MADYQVGLGSTTNKVGFYGVSPVVQPASASQAASVMTSAATTTALRADLNEVSVLANAIRSALVNLGLIKGSA